MSVLKEDSILKMDNRFGSVGMGSSEIIYRFLYPNRWGLVNQIDDSDNW